MANYRIFFRAEDYVDVEGDSFEITKPERTVGTVELTLPNLQISKAGVVVAVFPQGAWIGLLII